MRHELPLRIAILGAGGRGRDTYGGWILRHPERALIAAVAEIDPERLESFGDLAGVPARGRFASWERLLDSCEELALDAIIVALPDRQHVEPALRIAELGLAILLEKPAAVTSADLERLAGGLRRHQGRVAVGHVLRFTPFWRTVAEVVSSRSIGRLLTIRLEENIGFWHFAHSYVRGNWRKTAESSPMVLAKTCHDLDLIRWLAGCAPRSVYSVGSLTLFREENAPPGAPDRCTDGCPHSRSCPFYAPRYYSEALSDVQGWPISLLSSDTSAEGRAEALATGPYGRCVFHSDNDVVDHQQTVMEFPGGLTATLSTSALTGENTRTVRITGALGELTGHMDSGEITVDLFSPLGTLPELEAATIRKRRKRGPLKHDSIDLVAAPPGVATGEPSGHAGGDDGLMESFTSAVELDEFGPQTHLSLEAALDSHRMAFLAEKSRLCGEAIPWP